MKNVFATKIQRTYRHRKAVETKRLKETERLAAERLKAVEAQKASALVVAVVPNSNRRRLPTELQYLFKRDWSKQKISIMFVKKLLQAYSIPSPDSSQAFSLVPFTRPVTEPFLKKEKPSHIEKQFYTIFNKNTRDWIDRINEGDFVTSEKTLQNITNICSYIKRICKSGVNIWNAIILMCELYNCYKIKQKPVFMSEVDIRKNLDCFRIAIGNELVKDPVSHIADKAPPPLLLGDGTSEKHPESNL